MTKTFLVLIGISTIISTPIALACSSVQECNNEIRAREIKVQEIKEFQRKTARHHTTSVTGALFLRDSSNPELKEAYRDPSGLIWGEVLTATSFNYSNRGTQTLTATLKQSEAAEFCNQKGARLPTRSEVEKLAEYLGKNTPTSYSAYVPDSDIEVLGPNSQAAIWTSDANTENRTEGLYFSQSFGGIHSIGKDSRVIGARCVSRPGEVLKLGLEQLPSCKNLDLLTAAVGTACLTSVGSDFTLIKRDRDGETWRGPGPNSVVWGDLLKDDQSGKEIRLQEDSAAANACVAKGMSQPSVDDYVRARDQGIEEVIPDFKKYPFFKSSNQARYRSTYVLVDGYWVRCIQK